MIEADVSIILSNKNKNKKLKTNILESCGYRYRVAFVCFVFVLCVGVACFVLWQEHHCKKSIINFKKFIWCTIRQAGSVVNILASHQGAHFCSIPGDVTWYDMWSHDRTSRFSLSTSLSPHSNLTQMSLSASTKETYEKRLKMYYTSHLSHCEITETYPKTVV